VKDVEQAARAIGQAGHLAAFTGAGISVESGIPTFRGPNGIWSKYDPVYLDIDFYRTHADQAWPVIKEMFYRDISRAHPNQAHQVLADWENKGLLKAIITQNIDRLHQKAGNKNVIEYHGNAEELVCMNL